MRIYNFFLEKIFLPIGDLLTGLSIAQNLKMIRSYDSLTIEELYTIQLTKLNKLLQYATINSEYYSQFNIPKSDDPVLWLKKFPILEKNDLRLNESKILTIPKRSLNKISSSGSTGERSSVYLTQEELSYIRSNQIHWWEWAGYRLGDKVLQTGISKPRYSIKRLKNIFFRTNYVQAFSYNELDIINTLLYVASNENLFVVGFASSLYLYAQKAKEMKYKSFKVKGIISLGGKLFDEYRELIEQVFSCKVNDTYGCGEGIGVACQKDLDYMYIILPNVYIEIVDDKGNDVEDGKIGNVLLTNLNAFAYPLIRYRIGDLASLLPEDEYPKLREFNYPLLKNIIGRDTDIVRTKSGKYMVVHSFTAIFKYIPSIKQFCVIQRDLEGIEIEYIEGESFKKSDLETIQNEVDNVLNEHFPIDFKKVSIIKPTLSGKPQMVQSYLPKVSLNK